MKRLIFIASVIIMTAVMSVSCSKDPSGSFCGNYSFKCSAVLDVQRDEQRINDTVIAEADEVTRYTVTESGQMDIVSAGGKDESDIIITMNITGGGLVILNAEYKDGTLVIPSQSKHVDIKTGLSGLETTECMLNVEGTAKKLENLIVFELEYSGDYMENGRSCHVVGSEVSFRAKLNED